MSSTEEQREEGGREGEQVKVMLLTRPPTCLLPLSHAAGADAAASSLHSYSEFLLPLASPPRILIADIFLQGGSDCIL